MKRLRNTLLVVAAVAITIALTLVVLQQTGVYRGVVEGLIAKIVNRERFAIDDADVLIGDGKVTVDRFTISNEADANRPLVAIDRVELEMDTLGSFGRIRQVKLDRLHLDLDLSDGAAPDLGAILREQVDDGREHEPNGPPPAIEVSDSTITLRFAPDAEPIEFTEVELTLLPDEPGSAHMILSGSMTSPSGLPTRLSGSGDFGQQRFRALLEIVDFPLDPSRAARFSPAVAEILRSSALSGHADRLVLWVEFDGSRPEESAATTVENATPLVSGLRLDLSAIRGSPPGVDYSLIDASARISGSTRDGGSLRFEIVDDDSAGDLRASGQMTACFSGTPKIEATLEGRQVVVGPAVRDALCSHPIVESVWRAFDPHAGRFDVRCTLDNRDEPQGAMRVELDLKLHDVTSRWRGVPTGSGVLEIPFPEALPHVNGEVHLRKGGVTVDGVTFDMCGGRAALDGFIAIGTDEESRIELAFEDVPFGERARAAIASVAPGAEAFYDDYSPEGTASGNVILRGSRATPLDVAVTIRPLSCSATYAGFPYRLHGLRGRIDIGRQGVAFDLDAARGEATARLHGRFASGAGGADANPIRVELWVDSKNLAIDRGLEEALATLGPGLEDTIRFYAPSGRADCELTLWRDERAAEASYDIRIDARNVNVELETLPLPIRRLHGPLFVHGTGADSRVDIGIVNGRIENAGIGNEATVTIQGSIEQQTGGAPRFDVVSTVRDLELTPQLRDALDHNGAFDATTWNVIAPAGFVDIIARQHDRDGDGSVAHELDIELAGASSHATMLPTPATQAYGGVRVREGRASLRDIRARMSGCDVFCSAGEVWHEGNAARFIATVSSERMPIDDNLANLFTGPLRSTYLSRNLRGVLDVGRLTLDFTFPDDATDNEFSVEMEGRFGVRDAQLVLGAQVEDIFGSWTLSRSRIDRNGGTLRGAVESGGLTIAGHRLNGMQCRFRADPDQVELRDLRGRIHNGTLIGRGQAGRPDLVYRFADEGALATELGWNDLSLSTTLRASGVDSPDYRGNLSGTLELDELVGTDIHRAIARGEVRISQGRLGVVPIFTAIYSHLAARKRPQFDGVRVAFDVRDQLVSIPEIEVSSPVLSVRGSGTLAMDGYLDMILDFADLFGHKADWLVLPTVARMLTTGVVRFRVFGYLRGPQARPQWLWESAAPRLPLGPIPARDR